LALPDPSTAASHLSVDLVFRYLPQIYARARDRDAADRLTALLAKLLRQWPLSGVLSEIEEAPTTPLDFGGHPGLLLLFAERWHRCPKPAWRPTGRAAEFADLVQESLRSQNVA
jgi:hypothetical protein